MAVAVALGHVLDGQIGGCHTGAAHIGRAQIGGQTAAVQTVADLVHLGAEGELGRLGLCQNVGHNPGPKLQRRVGGELLQALGLVKAKPHHAHIIGGDTGKPTVVVGAGGTGLAAHLDAVDGGLSAGTGLDDAREQLDHMVTGLGGHGHSGNGIVVQQQLAVGIIDLGVQDRGGVLAIVDKGAVGRRHLQNGNTVGQRAHGQGRDLPVAEHPVVLFQMLHQGETQVLGGPVKGAVHAQALDQIHSYGIVGLCDTVEDGGAAAVGTAFVIGPAGAVAADGVILGSVVHNSDRGHQTVFQSRGINRNGLDGRTGASLGGGGTVEHQVAFLLASAAVKGLHMAGIGIHQHHGGLGIGTILAQPAGEVLFIQENGVHLGLDHGIQGGDDLQTARQQKLFGHGLAVAQLGLQVILYRPVDGIHEIALIFFLGGFILAGRAIGFYIFRQSLLPLAFADIAVFLHLAQDDGPALGVGFGEALQVVAVGVFDDAGDGGAFGQRQFAQFLVEIGLCRLLHAVGTLAEVDGVQVHLQDVVLFVLLFQLQGTHDFPELAFDRGVLVVGEVLDQLLGDGTAAAGEVVQHTRPVDGGADGALPVDALVGVEAVILHRDKGQLQLLGDILQIHPDTVLHAVELVQLHLFTGLGIQIIDKAGEIQPVAVQIDLHVIADVLVDVDGEHHAADGRCGETHQKDGQQQKAKGTEGPKTSSFFAQNQNSFRRLQKRGREAGLHNNTLCIISHLF